VDTPGVGAVMAYIERNPVRAGMVDWAEDYPWSSAAAHVTDRDESGLLEAATGLEDYTKGAGGRHCAAAWMMRRWASESGWLR